MRALTWVAAWPVGSFRGTCVIGCIDPSSALDVASRVRRSPMQFQASVACSGLPPTARTLVPCVLHHVPAMMQSALV